MDQNGSFRNSIRFTVGLLAILACSPNVFSTLIRGPYPLAEIAEKADLIIKAKAVSTIPVSDEWFKTYPGFAAYSTRMQVISVTKGTVGSSQIEFHHYGIDRQSQAIASMMALQLYDFEPGRSYILFCARTGQEIVFRQLWANQTMKADQGVYLAADDAPVGGREAKDILYEEFSRMLTVGGQQELLYAIRQLDEMSNPAGRLVKLSDFDRDRVLARISPLMSSQDELVAAAAIQTVGGSNPYFKDDNAIFWLAKVGARPLPGIGPWESAKNPGAHQYYLELMRIADGMQSVELRSIAIRALGRAGQPVVLESALRWANAAEPQIREATTILLADFRDKRVNDLVALSAKDVNYRVRRAAAQTIGFGQLAELLPILNDALHDGHNEVRRAAALSLVSFSPAQSADILRANMNDAEYKSVFVNVLASDNAEPCLDALCEIIERDLQPPFWSGRIPSADSWGIVIRYLVAQRQEVLQSGRFDRAFDVLERARIFSSSEPRDLYELYVKNGLKDRAARFRGYLRRTAPFDMEEYLDRVDAAYGFRKE